MPMSIPVAPRIIQHPGVRLEVDERQDLLMDCVVQGNPSPGVQWTLPNGGKVFNNQMSFFCFGWFFVEGLQKLTINRSDVESDNNNFH